MSGQIQVESAPGGGDHLYHHRCPLAVLRDEEVERRRNSPPRRSRRPRQEPVLCSRATSILLAEDNEVNMEIATEILSMRRVGGDPGLERRWRRWRSSRPPSPSAFDAILMDMQMPQMDGCEAARSRSGALPRPDAEQVPIIAGNGQCLCRGYRRHHSGWDERPRVQAY